MVELRALAYFATVCRCGSLTSAAVALGIAPSTLSTTLKSLGEALGLALFGRLNAGLYPTEEASWLMRVAEPLLTAEAFARRWVPAPRRLPAQILVLEIGLDFTFGHVGAAVRRAVAMLAAERPDVLVDVKWTSVKDARTIPGLAEAWPDATRSTMTLAVADGGTRDGKPVTMLRDRWVYASRLPAVTASPTSAAELAAGRVVVPALATPLLDAAKRYLDRRGVRAARFVDDDPGDLPRVIDQHPDAALFVPGSMVMPRLGLLHVQPVVSDPPLVTVLVAHLPRPDPVATLFTRHLKRLLAEPASPAAWQPEITLRQVHYFNRVYRLRRVSAAARGANVSQPALSEQLKKLERIVGGELFERRGDGVVPTALGDRFSVVATAIETVERSVAAGGSPSPAGRIAFGILPSVSQHGLLVNRITDAVVAVQARHPAVKLVIQEAPNGTLQDWVARGLVGAAIVETGPPHMPRLPLGSSESLAAVAHARHALLPPGPVRLADLVRLPLALPTARFGLRRLLEAAAEERGLRIKPFMEVDALTMLAAILARVPVLTVLPASSVRRELAAGELTAHPIVDPVIARRLFVIYSGERSLSDAERDLVNTLRARLSETTDLD